jgi:hypothetical protein
VIGSVALTDNVTNKEIIEVQCAKQSHIRLMNEGKEEEASEVLLSLKKQLIDLQDRNKKLSVANDKLSKYLERKRRIQYDDKKAIYIVKHKEFLGVYKVGVANNLTSRMSTYNTCAPEDYEVVHFQYTTENSLVENMVRHKFLGSLYSHNKEWYESPEGPYILIEAVKEAVSFFGTK